MLSSGPYLSMSSKRIQQWLENKRLPPKNAAMISHSLKNRFWIAPLFPGRNLRWLTQRKVNINEPQTLHTK